MNNEIDVIIATIAFGMGINKRNVRFVVHYNMPKSFEAYVQECGRAGRDQKKAYCILYYEYNDRKRHDYMIGVAHNTGARKKENLHGLYSMIEYCEEPYNCRRKMCIEFLGEKFNAELCHRMCDNCRKEDKIENLDVTKEAIHIMQFIQ